MSANGVGPSARILMVAPEPVFSPRGTPISVINRCRALGVLGHRVDLVTYPLGQDVEVAGLRYLRAPRIPGVKSVKIGASMAKVPLDLGVFATVIRQLQREKYDVLHTHEEAGVLGWWLRRFVGLPHVHDMHNDLAMVLQNFGYSSRHPLTRFASWLESRMISSADTTMVIFPELAHLVRSQAPSTPVHVVHNIEIAPAPDDALSASLRQRLAPAGEPLVVYTGTLEPYQGLDILVAAMAQIGPSARGQPRLAVVGGREDQIATLRRAADSLGIGSVVTFAGLRPPAEIPAWLAAGDVVVSPRSVGSNIPLKLYSYLRAGRPLVVTDIPSHTQVVDATSALVVGANAGELAAGIEKVLSDPVLSAELGARARLLATERFGADAYLRGVAACYADVGFAPPEDDEVAALAARLEAG